MLAASAEAVECIQVLSKTGDNIAGELLKGREKFFLSGISIRQGMSTTTHILHGWLTAGSRGTATVSFAGRRAVPRPIGPVKGLGCGKDTFNALGEPGLEITALADVSIDRQVATVEAGPTARG
ncbi:MAG: hypothetical protein CBC23_006735 [Rhodospirillaceae bacterium TMED63]|nr:hypothetical protein [Rhodospirillaceae bacterium]RPF99800.1 MAG: hypothetical protein CBC23_006735 [Rhodospirillaceae bacterium TMED63]